MKKIIILLFLLNSICAYCQKADTSRTKKNTIIVELGGWPWYYTINYDRFILGNDSFGLGMKAGISYLPYNSGFFIIPIELNGSTGNGKHFFEYSIGLSNNIQVFWGTKLMPSYKPYGDIRLGYRLTIKQVWIIGCGITVTGLIDKRNSPFLAIPVLGLRIGKQF